MNDTPLSNATVDELLSAELDGEFDAAARDLGMTPEAARAQLAQTPGVEARRRAMRTARDALVQPSPELDDVSAARIRAAALAAAAEQNDKNASTRRRHQRMYAVAGIAAALAGVVALVAVVSRGPSASKSSAGIASAAAPSTRALPRAQTKVDFGAFGDQAALAQQLRTTPIDEWGTERYAATKGAAASAPNLDKSAGQAQSNNGSDGSFSLKASNTTTTLSCADATARAAAGGRPVVQGTAVVGGRAVQVTIVARAHDNVAIVLAPDCSLVEQLVVP